jgi:hypothetical protein
MGKGKGEYLMNLLVKFPLVHTIRQNLRRHYANIELEEVKLQLQKVSYRSQTLTT